MYRVTYALRDAQIMCAKTIVGTALKPIKIASIQNQKETRKRKTENTFVQKILEFTREILNSDDVLKNSQDIYKLKKIHNLPSASRCCS